jgi:hypothetical protein
MSMERTDRAVVGVQLGRDPRGRVSVATRCLHGLPSVIRTEPVLGDGEPFPTLYWLTCPAAAGACGRLESEGLMRILNERLAGDPELAASYAKAHADYVRDRSSTAVLDGNPGVGGMPDRVKCLHALYAHEAATGANPVGALVRETIDPVDCPGPCVEVLDDTGSAVPGHPHMRNR